MSTRDTTFAPAIWPSVARLAATGGIFVFHWLGMMGLEQSRLDVASILIFCFLSGYLANITRSTRSAWAVRRYFRVMVPYWLVIIPILLLNRVFHYKAPSLAAQVITIFGGNMFLDDPVYVIAWYITLVLLLYCYAYAESYFRSWQVSICTIVGAVPFFLWLGGGYFFVAFVAGLRLSDWRPASHSKETSGVGRRVATALFVIQQYCYPFFLVHGAVLVFFFRKMAVSPLGLLLYSLPISTALSVILYAVSKPLQERAATKALVLVEKMRLRFSTAQP